MSILGIIMKKYLLSIFVLLCLLSNISVLAMYGPVGVVERKKEKMERVFECLKQKNDNIKNKKNRLRELTKEKQWLRINNLCVGKRRLRRVEKRMVKLNEEISKDKKDIRELKKGILTIEDLPNEIITWKILPFLDFDIETLRNVKNTNKFLKERVSRYAIFISRKYSFACEEEVLEKLKELIRLHDNKDMKVIFIDPGTRPRMKLLRKDDFAKVLAKIVVGPKELKAHRLFLCLVGFGIPSVIVICGICGGVFSVITFSGLLVGTAILFGGSIYTSSMLVIPFASIFGLICTFFASVGGGALSSQLFIDIKPIVLKHYKGEKENLEQRLRKAIDDDQDLDGTFQQGSAAVLDFQDDIN